MFPVWITVDDRLLPLTIQARGLDDYINVLMTRYIIVSDATRAEIKRATPTPDQRRRATELFAADMAVIGLLEPGLYLGEWEV